MEYDDYSYSQKRRNIEYAKAVQEILNDPLAQPELKLKLSENIDVCESSFVFSDTVNNKGMQIVSVSLKNEPSAKKLVYGEDGCPDISNEPEEYQESRKNVLLQTLKDNGNIDNLIKIWVDQDTESVKIKTLISFTSLILSSKNPKLELMKYLKAFECSSENGESIGKKFGVTRQAISKGVLHVQQEYGANKTRSNKSEESRDVYRKTNKRNYKPQD